MIRWPGGILFVGSLAFTAYAFVVLWGDVRPLNPRWSEALAVNAAMLTVFAFHHSLFARDRVKDWMARLVPALLIRSVYVWIASLLLIFVVWNWQPLGGSLYRLNGAVAWTMRGLQIVGVALIAASVRAIDGLELAGIRPARTDTALYVRGPYGFVRHPLYLGWVPIVLGTPHMTGDRLAFGVLTTAYLVVAMPWEERSLMRLYGDVYRTYMARVRWRLVPFLY